jgi:Phenylacetic acid-responsive transcriptional repressor
MERNEISLHEVKVYRVFKEHSKAWLTHKDIAKISELNERTVRAHTLRLVRSGVLDQAELFPAHRYRLSQKADKRNKGYMQRLLEADTIFASVPV